MANERRPEQESFHDVIDFIRKGASTAPAYRIINIPLDTARSGEELALAGYNFQVIDASDGFAFIEIQFNETLANKVPFRRGDQVITPFYRFYIHNIAQAGAFLKVAISPHFDLWRFIPNPFASAIINNIYDPSVPGNVRNIFTEVRAGVMYRKFIPFVAPPAGNVKAIQVFNPIGSKKTVFVTCMADVGGTVIHMAGRYYNTALTTLSPASPLVNLNQSVLLSNLNSVAEIRSQDFTLAAFPPAGVGPEQWFFINGGTGQNLMFSFSQNHPAILLPGKGFIGYFSLLSVTAADGGEHVEDTISLRTSHLYIETMEV